MNNTYLNEASSLDRNKMTENFHSDEPYIFNLTKIHDTNKHKLIPHF